MISPWMIEKIKKAEEQAKEEARPRLEIPLFEEIPCKKDKDEIDSGRGVIIIGGDDEEEGYKV